MSLRELINGEKRKIHKLDLNEIEKSNKNFYEAVNEEDYNLKVEAIKESILEIGLINPITVFKKENGKYEIISGHTRYNAVLQLSESGLIDSKIECIIQENFDEESHLKQIIESNIQRQKNEETNKIEFDFFEKEYEKLVQENRRPEGKKDDWIAKKLGISSRTVRRRRHHFNQDANDNQSNSITSNEVDMKKLIKKAIKILEKIRKNEDEIEREFNVDEINSMIELINILKNKVE
ncbi:ParB/RepB/Spo0J family partition protein [Bulleidia sp. zg-1006]|uniref:ParB/RepB/Spo0J family partition protein n=1 Tax=Bulleidia sp. zg-1006 TaxID=2806552 RepID=UPI00193A1C36|nr:ParB/RepB/Spo0J family partition protein [Bulleidia sp. zg-1006]QRG86081.1 ParB N-terminal domain-containing protein [Bulleidia sp. zg-1006]